MWRAENWKDYEVIDTSDGEKLERWGKFTLVRPDPQVIWNTPKKNPLWKHYDARYARSNSGGGKWNANRLPERWQVRYGTLTFNVKPMNFKHTGVFPEQAANWDFIQEQIGKAGRPLNVLNLFAYTGGATLAAAAAGASVCHVDAAKGMVAWAKENAKSSGLESAPIRWIVDDCAKFVERRPLRRNLEVGKGSLSFLAVSSRCAVRQSCLLYHQFLYNWAGPVGSGVSIGHHCVIQIRRPYGM